VIDGEYLRGEAGESKETDQAYEVVVFTSITPRAVKKFRLVSAQHFSV